MRGRDVESYLWIQLSVLIRNWVNMQIPAEFIKAMELIKLNKWNLMKLKKWNLAKLKKRNLVKLSSLLIVLRKDPVKTLQLRGSTLPEHWLGCLNQKQFFVGVSVNVPFMKT